MEEGSLGGRFEERMFGAGEAEPVREIDGH
jgi:hypothetical protein